VATHGSFVAHVCHVARLIPCKVILIRMCSNIEVLYHRVHMRFVVMINSNYLVVENDDTKNG
jgi:hypothetical protein